MKKSDAIQSGNVQLPYNRYTLRIKDANYGLSKSSGNPMFTLDCEIVSPQTVELADGKVGAIDGIRITHYLSITEKSMANYLETCKRLGVPDQLPDGDFDAASLQLDKTPFVGVQFDAICSSQERELRQRPKPGQRVGDPIVDSEGKPIKSGWDYRINEILGKVG